MKIKYTLTLFCVTLTLAFLLVSCADTSGDGGGGDNGSNTNGGGDNGSNTNGGGDTTEKQFSNVSAESCGDSTLELNCFISVWNTANSGGGASDSTNIVLPLVSDGTYDFYVDWGDESEVQKITSSDEVTHTYTTPGEKTIHIAGTIKGWRFFADNGNYGDAVKLLNVTQWGSLSLGNTAGSQFYGAQNFNPTATDAPDVSETTSLLSAFNGASAFNQDINDWDVSQVTDMAYMFNFATSFNNNGKPLDWRDKTSKVTDMEGMFNFASAFNQDISSWNLSEVTDMSFMFNGASSFNNGDEELDWGDKTSKVTDMEGMFSGASDFNQDISKWNVENVESSNDFATGSGLIPDHTPPKFRDSSTVSEQNCASNPLLHCFISTWKTDHGPSAPDITGVSGANIVKLPLVEGGTYDFYVDWGDGSVQQIKEFNASEVTHTYDTAGEYTIHIAGTIKGWRFFVSAFNQQAGTANDYGDAVKLLNVTQWGSLSLGNTAGSQFYGAQNFNPTATDAPDVSETTSLSYAFASAGKFNADISDWDVSKVTSMTYMFWDAKSFNNNGKPLDWGDKTSKVTDMEGMFGNASNFNADSSDWNVSQVTDMSSMFYSATSFNNNGAELNWGDKTSNVSNMGNMFLNASLFNQDVSGWDVEKVTSYSDFAENSGLELNNIPYKFRGLDTISKAICDANPLTNCFISVWNTANSGGGASDGSTIVLPLVNNGEYNFYVDWGDESEVEYITNYSDATHEYDDADEYTVHIAGTIKGWRFFVSQTGGVNNYGDAAKLLNVTQWGSLSLGNTDGRQFQGAANFNPTATDAPNLSETTSLSYAFASASKFNADISDWDVSKVTSMPYMFWSASSFNNNGKPLDWGDKTSNVTDTSFMFWLATNFNQDISAWDVGEVTSMLGMFYEASSFNNKDGKELDWGDKTSNVSDMSSMFYKATSFNQDISDWDVSKVTTMTYMFYLATSFNNNGMGLDWDDKTSKVTDMEGMFLNASLFNQDISGWDVENVTRYNAFAKGSGIENKPEYQPAFKAAVEEE